MKNANLLPDEQESRSTKNKVSMITSDLQSLNKNPIIKTDIDNQIAIFRDEMKKINMNEENYFYLYILDINNEK